MSRTEDAPSGTAQAADVVTTDTDPGSQTAEVADADLGTQESGKPVASRPRRRRRLLAGLVALVVLVALGAAAVVWWQRPALPSDAAFRVGDKVVTVSQLQRRIEVLRALYGLQVPQDPAQLDRFRRDTAKATAISMVIDQTAQEQGIQIADKAVSDALDRFLAQRYPQGGRPAYVQALTAQGIGESDVLDEIRRQLIVRQLFDRQTAGISVSDAQLRQLFDKNPAAYAVPEQRRLSHIVVADQAQAQALLDRLRAGADFATLAKTTSLDASTKQSGGDLGLVAARDLDPAFAKAAFAAPVGGLFGPVQTRFGWHVGKVEAVTPGHPTTFEQVRDQLRQQQETEQAVARWRTFLEQRVKAAHVVYADAYRPADPAPVIDAPPASSGPVPASGGPTATPSP